MATEKIQASPYCTICIVVAALLCHTGVLLGNLQTANSFGALGESTGGWSDVGLSMSRSLKDDLDAVLHRAVENLSSTLETVLEMDEAMNMVMSSTGNASDEATAALLQAKASPKHLANLLEVIKSDDFALAQSSSCVGRLHCHSSFWGPHSHSKLSGAIDSNSSSRTEGATDDAEVSGHGVSLLQGHFRVALASAQREDATVHESQEAKRQAPVVQQPQTYEDAQVVTRAALQNHVAQAVETLKGLVKKMMELLKPVLLKVGEWINSMGDKMQRIIEEFGIIIDKVQKILDEIMKKIAGGNSPEATTELLFNVFAIFDQSKDGNVYLADLQNVSALYGITALQGKKAEELLSKYDASGTGSLQRKEFDMMMSDPSVPSAGPVVLRTYAKKLGAISGNLKGGKTRGEIAYSLVNYLTLVAAKNRTKLSWISQALTNQSLPLNFTADVLVELAALSEDTRRVSLLDVGQLVISEMTKLGSSQTAAAVALVCDPEWWTGAGHSTADQPRFVERITNWAKQAGVKTSMFLLQHQTETAAETVKRRSQAYWHRQHLEKRQRHEALFSSATSASLFQEILGVVAPVGAETDEDLGGSLKSSVPAKPETLAFAKWLSENTSQVSSGFEHQCFDEAKTSSSAMDSFANMVQTSLKKIQEFLNLMQRYSTPAGIKQLESRIQEFLDHALDEVAGKVDAHLDKTLLLQTPAKSPSPSKDGLWKELLGLTKQLKEVLPTVMDNMKVAKKEISAIAKMMDQVFDVFKAKGNPIFQQVKSLYKTLWMTYFVVFVTLTIGVLFYGLWATGYLDFICGGPVANTSGDYVPPATLKERVLCCWRACTGCVNGCTDSHACFWSCIILAEVVVLLMFIIAIVLTLLAGVKAFMSVGCSSVYLLNDESVCTGILSKIQGWLTSFWSSEPFELGQACDRGKLTTCKVISEKMMQSAMLTCGGSMLAALVTAQMIFESARLHEASVWGRAIAEDKPGLYKETN